MKKLSQWGKNHPVLTRLILIVAHFLLVIDAVFLGFVFFVQDLHFPQWLMWLWGNVFFLAFFFYPDKKAKNAWFRYSYRRQKTMDFLLVAAIGLVLMVHTNRLGSYQPELGSLPPYTPTLIAIQEKNASTPSEMAPQTSVFSRIKESRKALRLSIKAKLQTLKAQYKQQGDRSGQGLVNALLILLAIVGFVGLLYLVAALSCSVACSGAEGLGILLAIIGTLAAIWLLFLAIRGITRRIKKQNAAAEGSGS